MNNSQGTKVLHELLICVQEGTQLSVPSSASSGQSNRKCAFYGEATIACTHPTLSINVTHNQCLGSPRPKHSSELLNSNVGFATQLQYTCPILTLHLLPITEASHSNDQAHNNKNCPVRSTPVHSRDRSHNGIRPSRVPPVHTPTHTHITHLRSARRHDTKP